MIAAVRSKSLFLLCLMVASAKAWELPSFLSKNLPLSHDQSKSNNDRDLQANNKTKPVDLTPILIAANTDSPTESPAPSPSPSETPTLSPTVTDKPTGKPTASPTESPAPSPSPSETPTIAPSASPSIPPTNYPTVSSMPSTSPSVSPSDVPSAMPSVLPSAEPTVSMQPSATPSHAPSDIPSASPTISTQPSTSPSASPTSSMQPSSAPTLMRVVSADFTVLLPIESGLLSDAQIAAMQNATAGFVDQDVAIASGILEDVTVGVMWQRVVDVSNVTTVVATTNATNNGTLRELSSGQSEFALKQALAIDFTVLTMYIGSDNDFDLYAALDAEFQDPASRWFVWLSAADVVFEPLAPEPTPEEKAASAAKSELDSQSGSGASNGTVALVSLLAVAALALGIAASVFSVRQYKRNGGYGQELGSPRLSATSSGLGSRIANENIEYHNKQLELDARTDKSKKTKGEVEKQVEEVEVDSATSSWMNPPTSPNSLENGSTVAFDQIMQNKPRFTEPVEDRWSHIQPSNSGNHRATKDPPSAESEINFSTATQTHADPRNMSSLFDNNTEMSEMTRSHAHNEANHEITLTKSMGGTLGATAVAGSNAGSGFTASDFSSHAKSFFSGLVGGQGARAPEQDAKTGPPNGVGDETLGARAVTPKEAVQLQEQISYDSMTNRAGLYDVFAPPGPIGIVVDTTKHGPAVHSLKRTSPMLGLINPGDLIVGLDDEDARGMTAATLTRLMARKSNQKERKITLLTGDNNL